MNFPCNRDGAIAVGTIFRQAREAKGWVLRDLVTHGLKFGTVSHYENGLLNKYMDELIVTKRLEVLQPINQDTGEVWTLAAIKALAAAKPATNKEA
ncbi:helix-turn-helix transcriptional regulator [Stenomitos frigidus]|uniref:XRE family transcriptional regulator n=1 Tax=Stenomitos frigidus ULC18 TaxID=2107698 RepID=A0A2T1E7Y8_9CYAN|nr:helix-turn-helix transcriptional regulator [Stenomitos frigidus]PSB28859.1 hypothetical protein C7B82_12470 [Stenomitos frigidus ULC18]